jgi:hypothetical protein
VLLALGAALTASACAPAQSPTTAPPSPARSTSPSASSSPSTETAPANAHGSFTFSGWLEASGVGPVQPLALATLAGAVPNLPAPTPGAGGVTLTGSAAGTQCFHASSRSDIDQYEVFLVFLVRGERYLLTLAEGFQRAGQNLGEATPPAGGPLSNAGNNADQIHLDPEAVPLSEDPAFVASYSDGTVILARDLRSGSVDVTLKPTVGPPATPAIHVTGTFTCP